VSEKTSWIEDPKLARTLARLSWMVIVGGFVILTRWRLSGAAEDGALGIVIATVLTMNLPVVVGLQKSLEHTRTRAFRVVALMLILRIAALAWVVWAVRR
jgi:hypothetical protein